VGGIRQHGLLSTSALLDLFEIDGDLRAARCRRRVEQNGRTSADRQDGRKTRSGPESSINGSIPTARWSSCKSI
jgi:hypothetical protein